MRKILLLLVLVLGSQLFAQNGIIYLVRHAERESDAKDSLLSKARLERAECLMRTLHDAKIATIYVTEYKRTQQTAEPLARRLGISPVVVSAHDTNAITEKALQDSSISKGSVARNVLVVAHSDTLPAIIARLGTGTIPPLSSNDYDFLFEVNRTGGKATLITLHYCPVLGSAPAEWTNPEQMQRILQSAASQTMHSKFQFILILVQ